MKNILGRAGLIFFLIILAWMIAGKSEISAEIPCIYLVLFLGSGLAYIFLGGSE